MKKKTMIRRMESGFTLIEVLMALTIFSLIAAVSYGALGVAGDGFRMLSAVRDSLETAGWTGRQLRSDITYLTPEQAQSTKQHGIAQASTYPLRIKNDNRGISEYDQLLLTVSEPGQAGVTLVRYYIDENKGHLMRESRLLWARDQVEPLRWDMGEAVSFSVELMDQNGKWQQEWQTQGVFVWPRAVKIHTRVAGEQPIEHEWVVPVLFGTSL